MAFDKLSIIFIAIIAIFGIIGLCRGFFKTLLSLFKGVVSFIISTFISKPIASVLSKSKLGVNWSNKLAERLASKGGVFVSEYNPSSPADSFELLKINDNIKNIISKLIEKLFPSIEAGQTVAEVLAPTIIYYSFIVIAFIVSFIFIRVIILLLSKLFKGFERNGFIKFTNRLLGLALNLVIGVCVVCIVTYAFTFIIPLDNNASAWIINEMHLNDDVFTLSKFLYNNNLLCYLINLVSGWLV